MKTRLSQCLLGILFVSNISLSTGEIFKWVDKNGAVHFGDRPPAQQGSNYSSSSSSTNKPTVSNAQRRAKQKKLLEAFAEDHEMKNKQDAKKKQQREKKNKNCNSARDKLKRYQRSSRIYRLGKDGNRQFMDQQQRNNEVSRMQSLVKKWCK